MTSPTHSQEILVTVHPPAARRDVNGHLGVDDGIGVVGAYPVASYARHDAWFRAHDVATPCLLLDLVKQHYLQLAEELPDADVYYAVKATAA